MKATGIVRKLDELGRVVVPSEIRKKLGLTEGANIEIYVSEENELVLKKFSPVFSLAEVSKIFADVTNDILKIPCAICDNESIVAVAGLSKKDYLGKRLSLQAASEYLSKKDMTSLTDSNIIDSEKNFNFINIFPIVVSGYVYGGVILFSETVLTSQHIQAGTLVSSYLSKLVS